MVLTIPMNVQGALDTSSLMGGLKNTGDNSALSVVFQNTSSHPNSPPGEAQYNHSNNVGSMFAQPTVQRPTTGVILRKGQKVILTGGNGQSLTAIEVGLGWDVADVACDLDASAFLLGDNRRVLGDDWFVFYGQPLSPDRSVRHSGDSKGDGVGDDETISINFLSINPAVKRIVFVVTIDEAFKLNLNFSMVRNAYVRVTDSSTGKELARFNLTDYYANVTSMVVGEVYLHNGQWKFNAVGDGVAKDLSGLCAMYGVVVVG